MPYLTINGFDVSVREQSVTEDDIDIGGMSRAYSGKLRGTKRAEKMERSFSTKWLTAQDADALKAFLKGNGHYWSFDSDLYSSKGLGPRSGYSATLGTGGKYGGKVSITSITYAAGLTGDWAVLVYRWNGSSWDYYAVRSDGAKWLNGTRDDATSTAWLSVDADGDLTLTGSPTDYDELIALPYLATAAMIEAWHGLTTQFSPLPKLDISGDMVDGKAIEAMFDQVRVRPQSFAAGVHKQIDATLREV